MQRLVYVINVIIKECAQNVGKVVTNQVVLVLFVQQDAQPRIAGKNDADVSFNNISKRIFPLSVY